MRNLLKIGVLGLALAIAPAAFAQEKASLRLNWLYYGFHSFFPLAVDKGFYKEEGIELTIGAPLVMPAITLAPSDRPKVSDFAPTICTARPEPCPSPIVSSIPSSL